MRDVVERLTVGHYMLRRWSVEDDVRNLARLGFRSISLASSKLRAHGVARSLRVVKASGLRVAHLGSYGWFGVDRRRMGRGVDQVRRALDWLVDLGGDVLMVISGPRRDAPWVRAAAILEEAYARLLPEARAAGVKLALEVIHPLRQDLCFVNTLADASRLARRAGRGGGYLLDLWHSGWEPDLLATLARDARRRIHAVQLADVKAVTLRSGDRAMPGRGILPLRGIVRALERGGYRGWYELEVISDDLERMGYDQALRSMRTAVRRLAG